MLTRTLTRTLAALVAVACVLPACSASPVTPAPADRSGGAGGRDLVRVDRTGYDLHGMKEAWLLSRSSADGRRWVAVDADGTRVAGGPVGADVGRWNRRWSHVHRLVLDGLTEPGTYRVVVRGAGSPVSPQFEVAPAAERAAPMLADAVSFFRSQRDGADVPPGPLGRKQSHLRDANARVYAPPRYRAGRLVSVPKPLGDRVDLSGGWADAGDYLKFVTTTSYADIHLLLAARGPAADVGSVRTEALFGADWLDRMWDADSQTLYFQVGLGDGGRPGGEPVLGDHDRWRLPQDDDRIDAGPGAPAWFLGHRPAFRAGPPGSPVSPNLAGRLVAVFALRAQLEAESGDTDSALRRLRQARALFALARTRDVTPLTTTTPRSYYVEDEWRDDLELGAAELVLADLELGAEAPEHWLRTDLRSAARWARAYLDSPFHGFFTLARDDVSALGHAELARGLAAARGEVPAAYLRGLPVDRSDLVGDLGDQLDIARQRYAPPFGLTGDETLVTDWALGVEVTAHLFAALTRDAGAARAAEALGARMRGFVGGANPWGTSFVVGRGGLFPHCTHHQVANLVGSHDGTAPLLRGAVVPGPASLDEITGLGSGAGFYRRCSSGGFDTFDGHGLGYRDDVRTYASSEPALDFTAVHLLALAMRRAG